MRSRATMLGLCLITVLATAPASAQIVLRMPTYKLVENPSPSDILRGEGVAAGTDGTFVVIYNLYEGEWFPTDSAVFTQHFSNEGSPIAAPVRIDTSGLGYDAVVRPDLRGGYIAAWWRPEGSVSRSIHARLLDSRGVGTGPEINVAPVGFWPLATGVSSGTVVEWEGKGARFYDLLGRPSGTVFPLDGYPVDDIAPTADGGFIVVWSQRPVLHIDDSGPIYQWGRIYNSDGTPRADRFAIGYFEPTAIAVSPNGNIAIVGRAGRQPGEIRVRYFTSEGVPLTGEIVVTGGPFTTVWPSAVFDAQGRLLIVWSEYYFVPNTDTPPKGRAYDATGSPLGDVMTLSDVPAFMLVHTALLSNGSLMNVWRYFGESDPGPPYIQWANRDTLWANVVTLCSPESGDCPTPAPPRTPTPTPVPPVCGDGIISAGEECDDGNLVDGDGCDHNCTKTRCGNRIVTTGEECDDGNPLNGDGCDRNCTVTACGNGQLSAGEECDDGNDVDGDGCDTNCTTTRCGNEVQTDPEECDDGNRDNGDGCDAHCLIEDCGDGRLEGDEQCDDGNAEDGDGCESDCTLTPHHDSVLVPIDPVSIFIAAGREEASRIVPIQVRNADIRPTPEKPGHVIQLSGDDGDCPSGTIVSVDFDPGTAEDQDTALVPGGQLRIAKVIFTASRYDYELNPRVPQRCTVSFEATTVLESDNNVDPTPENNVIQVEINVYGVPDVNAGVARATTAEPAYFIASAKPLKATLLRGKPTLQKRIDVTVGTGAGTPPGGPARAVTVSTSDGECPAGTVGVSDFDSRHAGAQNTVTLVPGTTKRGKLAVTLSAAGFRAASVKSPARCTATLTSTAVGADAPATNHTTKLLIEVNDYNDF